MQFLLNILLLALIVFVLQYWWQSGEFKGRALKLAAQYCQQHELQLLDQSMVIKGYWPCRNSRKVWVMRRIYDFEFTSTGHRRYRGRLTLMGLQLAGIELEAYQLPES